MGSSTIYIFNKFNKYIKSKLLFITEDGIKVYEKDLGPMEYGYWPTVHCGTYFLSSWPTNSVVTTNRIEYPLVKIFSTKEKALQYINENEPKYSFNDIVGAIDQSLHLGKNYPKFIEKLKELNR